MLTNLYFQVHLGLVAQSHLFLIKRIHRRHTARRAVGQFIDAFIQCMTGVAFGPVPGDTTSGFMPFNRRQQPPPEILVFHRFFVGRAPPIALPPIDPLGNAIAQVCAVGVQLDPTGPFERLQCLDRGAQLHPVIGGRAKPAADGLFMCAILKHSRPPARSRIADTAAVGINND